MTADSLDALLDQFNQPGANILSLLQQFHTEAYARYWCQDPRLYRVAAWQLLRAGQPTRAFELVQEALVHHADQRELQYLRALALARGGNGTKAAEYVAELLQAPDLSERLQIEVPSLAGRLRKDRCLRAADPRPDAAAAADFYENAYLLSRDTFPGINAATTSQLAGRGDRAQHLAREVIERALQELEQPGRETDCWLRACLGEAHVLLGNLPEAARWYRQAVQLAAGRLGDIAAMRRNLLLLQRAQTIGSEIWELFQTGSVLVFSGHMIDHPERTTQRGLPPRFPADVDLEQRVAGAIGDALDELKVGVGYCSAACGADLLFAEQVLARGAELHVVLPFDRDDFCATSVDFGLEEMQGWRRRFEAVLGKATALHYATTERYLGEDALFHFANTIIQGLAIGRARQLGSVLHGLVVLDRASEQAIGGTASVAQQWRDPNRPLRVIDLARLRTESAAALSTLAAALPSESRALGGSSHRPREVMAMLFADVKNFSKLREEQAPAFFITFLNKVAEVIEVGKDRPIFQNTWGDGLYMVFDQVVACADFAMRLLDAIAATNWQQFGLPNDTTVRMGLHAGPVFRQRDPIIGRDNIFGSHVNRAARIEPVTTPGCAFASEQFAAALAVAAEHDFHCEYMGIVPLAKEFGHAPLYRLARA